MKKLFTQISLCFLLFVVVSAASCQQQGGTTIILIRHAEKDTVGGNDPHLSAVGYERAARLQATLKEFSPDVFYSTNYKRTLETVSPWAKAARKQIELYDSKKQDVFVNLLKSQTGKTIVVTGHSNTIPPLVNLITGRTEYKNLADDEYNKIFIVTLNKTGNAEVHVASY